MQQSFVRVVACYPIACILLISTVLSGLTLLPPKVQAVANHVKIMPLGDSITGSPGCWRALLWNKLQRGGYTNIDFVGTLNNSTSCGQQFDGDNEGHGNYLATKIVQQGLLPGWLNATNPDIIMMHLGTNDVWNHLSTTTILSAYSTLVDQMRAKNPIMKILVAQILPMNPKGCSDCTQGVINLNKAILSWATSKCTKQSPIIVVDQWTGFDDQTDTREGVHPNDAGNQKIANKWYSALTAKTNASHFCSGL